MAVVWLYSSIQANRQKTIWLVLLFPIFLLAIIFLFVYIALLSEWVWSTAALEAREFTLLTTNILIPIVIIRGIIAFALHRQMIFKFSGAKPVTRQQEPEIYNLIENMCISRWLPTPNIGIIEDTSMNAFAVWRKPEKSWIVFSRGILEKLDKEEIEAVAGHELTHIMNRDSLLMVVIIVFIWIISTLWEILIRVRGNSWGKKWNPLPLIWLALLIVWYLIYPLIRLAISRKREFMADAGAVELTKNPQAMISALQKISGDPYIESIQKDTVAAMCIQNPFDKGAAFFKNMLSTHPPIAKRIEALQRY